MTDCGQRTVIAVDGATNGEVELSYRGEARWAVNDLTAAAAGAPAAAGDPWGYTWSVDATQHDVYRGFDSHIHELWFHNRSRLGYRGFLGRDFGGTFWARGVFDPLPTRHDPFPGPAIDLAKPDIDRLRDSDPTLTAVLEEVRVVNRSEPYPDAEWSSALVTLAACRPVGSRS